VQAVPLQPIQPIHVVNYGGAVLNIYHADAGQGLPWHSHSYSHAVVCHAGACKVRKGSKEVTIKKRSTPINLAAPDQHEIEAIEDGTVFVTVFAEGKQ
jgi:quercetin dioxygenase-like cupin family protein